MCVDVFKTLNPEQSCVSSKGPFPRRDSLTHYGQWFLSVPWGKLETSNTNVQIYNIGIQNACLLHILLRRGLWKDGQMLPLSWIISFIHRPRSYFPDKMNPETYQQCTSHAFPRLRLFIIIDLLKSHDSWTLLHLHSLTLILATC